MTKVTTVTTQTATGTARGKYDRVSFSLTVEGRGTTGPRAKEEAQDIITNNIHTALEKLETFTIADGRTSFSINPTYVDSGIIFNKGKKIAGYRARYTLYLETSQVDKASKIQDVLTSIEGVSVDSPEFILEPPSRRKLQDLAVKAAIKVVKDRFRNECETLDLDLEDFEIEDWTAEYYDVRPHNNVVCVTNGRPDIRDVRTGQPITYSDELVQSGRAAVQAKVRVGFRRKVGVLVGTL